MRGRSKGVSLYVLLLCGLLAVGGCNLDNPSGSRTYQPARLPMGPLVLGAWLPAGLDEFRFGPEDEDLLLELGLNQVEWLQRAEVDGRSAEEMLMDFCGRQGWWMPVYYEPPGYSPYDKLHNWTRQHEVGEGFSAKVSQLVNGLLEQWEGQAGFGGYLVGHEDYRQSTYPALELTVAELRRQDPSRPAISVGHIDSYQAVERFLDVFFVEGGAPNIFQHEHYVFRAEVPTQGGGLQRAVDDLAASYDRVADRLRGRHGRWHAIVQVQSEWRQGLGLEGFYYRKPTAAEISLQAGLALSRGASGVIYFLYSSGVEDARNGEGEIIQHRVYEGLVDRAGGATPQYRGVQQLNLLLGRLGAVLEPLYFFGAFSSADLRRNPLVRRADTGLEFGIFGAEGTERYLLVVNRQTDATRQVRLRLAASAVTDALDGRVLPLAGNEIEVELEAGGMRLLKVVETVGG
jgi:hypothetical protein